MLGNKNAKIVCESCDWKTQGELPLGKRTYRGRYARVMLSGTLALQIQNHHATTGEKVGNRGEKFGGHRHFQTAREDGITGRIEANSYNVFYTQKSDPE